MKIYKKQWFILLCIVLLGAAVRLIWLDRIPSAIGGDELVYILEAKSVALTGRDLTGTWKPLSVLLFRYPPDQHQGELPYLLNIPVVGLLPFSLFAARITSAVLSVLTIVGLYLFVSELFSANVALLTALVMAINPWQIYIGRTAYDMVPAVCFYLWAMYVTITRKGRWMLWSVPLYMLAFYSYIGTKVILIPIVFVMSVYVWNKFPEAKNKKNIFIMLSILAVFIGIFLYTLVTANGSSRISEIISVNDQTIAHTVDTMRKISVRSMFVDLFVNKYIIFTTIILTKLSRVFSSEFLFAYGDQFYSLHTHGMFYFLDAFFLLAGMVTMFSKHWKKMLLVSLLALIGSVPHLIHGASTEDFTPHLVMLFPFLVLFIGYGIHEIVQKVIPGMKTAVVMIILCVYGLSLGNFLQTYWFQNPLYGNFDFSFRTMSKYLRILNSNQPVIVYSQGSVDLYKKYLFYGNLVSKDTIPSIRNSFAEHAMRIGAVRFVGCDKKLVIPADTVVLYDAGCGKPELTDSYLKITRLKDGGEEFRIYNDTQCHTYNLKSYPDKFTMKDLDIEHLTTRSFCETYIAR